MDKARKKEIKDRLIGDLDVEIRDSERHLRLQKEHFAGKITEAEDIIDVLKFRREIIEKSK